MKIYAWFGGYSLEEAVKTEKEYEGYNTRNIDMESVICTMIDNNEISCMNVDDIYKDQLDEMMDDDSWTYIDNTGSEVEGKNNCYMVLIENLAIDE